MVAYIHRKLAVDNEDREEKMSQAAYDKVLQAIREMYGKEFSFDVMVCRSDPDEGSVTFWTFEAWDKRNEALREEGRKRAIIDSV